MPVLVARGLFWPEWMVAGRAVAAFLKYGFQSPFLWWSGTEKHKVPGDLRLGVHSLCVLGEMTVILPCREFEVLDSSSCCREGAVLGNCSLGHLCVDETLSWAEGCRGVLCFEVWLWWASGSQDLCLLQLFVLSLPAHRRVNGITGLSAGIMGANRYVYISRYEI